MLGQSLKVLIIKIFGLLCGYLFFWLMGNYFGSEEVGRFSLFFTLLFIFSILAKLGSDTALVRFLAQLTDEPQKQRGIYLKGLGITILSGSFVSLLVFVLQPFIVDLIGGKLSQREMESMAFLITPFAIIHLNFEGLRGRKDVIGFSLFQNVFRFGIASVVLALGLMGLIEQLDSIQAYSLAVLITFVLSFIWIGYSLGSGPFDLSEIDWRSFLSTSLPMLLSASVFYILSWTDILMLGSMRTESEVGIYNTAFRLVAIANFPIMAVSAYAAPRFAEYLAKKDQFKQLVQQSSRLCLMASLPIILVLVLIPEQLLGIFGEEFKVGYFIVYILLMGQLVNSITGLAGDILQMSGNHKLFSLIILGGAILNIILNAILIPKFGYHGAALASAISLAGWKLCSAYFIRQRLGVQSIYLPILKRNDQ